MGTNSSLAHLWKNGVVLGRASLSAVQWVIFENILHRVTKQDMNHYGHEGSMINEIKKVLDQPALCDS